MARFVPAYTDYSVQALSMLSEKELRKEYTRMRDVAQKRVKRLQESFPESKASQKSVRLTDAKGNVVKEYVGFRKLEDLHPADISKALSEMAKFVGAKTSTVSGQRAQQIKTMNTLNKAIGATPNSGQAPVTKENYWRVMKILDRARKAKLGKIYGSDKIVTLAEVTLGLSDEQFDTLLDNLDNVLPHVDEVEETFEEYKQREDIKDFQVVDMSEFIKEIGW